MHFPFISRKICLVLTLVLLAASCGIGIALGLTEGLKFIMTSGSFSSSFSSVTSNAEEPSSLPSSSLDPTSSVAPPVPEIGLVITSPSKLDVTVTQPKTTITGTSDAEHPLKMNGKEIERDQNGAFSIDVELQYGNNVFTFEHKGKTTACNIRYRYVIIQSYDPSNSRKADGDTKLTVTVLARVGATVTAELNGQKLTLNRQSAEGLAQDAFCHFNNVFTLPDATSSVQNLGKIKFTAEFNGMSESFSSGNISVNKIYIPQIAEVVVFSAETFNGNSTDNDTRPTNNYLPAGTLDYVTGSFSKRDGKYNNHFLELRCGRRIYSSMYITPGANNKKQVAKVYEGYLPDHNELSVAALTQDEKFTTLTLNTLWKAPFLLDLLPQSYSNPAKQDYTVSSFTAQYVEIKFCYATVFSGNIEISADNPLFSKATVTQNAENAVLRLYFRKTGAFYGWDCLYNESGQLVFKFRHPAKLKAGDNVYGVDLTGITILVDAGHGGIDPGAGGGIYEEEMRNLMLANKLKAELEKTGATVKMTRTSDATLYSDQRIKLYRSISPDFLVSVHHDSSSSASANGFGSFYTTPFSQYAAKRVFEHTVNTGIYKTANAEYPKSSNWTKLAWHHFYMTRMTYCPSVLTENGFVSSTFDKPGIASDDTNNKKAVAITKGIADYFKALIK